MATAWQHMFFSHTPLFCDLAIVSVNLIFVLKSINVNFLILLILHLVGPTRNKHFCALPLLREEHYHRVLTRGVFLKQIVILTAETQALVMACTLILSRALVYLLSASQLVSDNTPLVICQCLVQTASALCKLICKICILCSGMIALSMPSGLVHFVTGQL
jgi:hypothetical protein